MFKKNALAKSNVALRKTVSLQKDKVKILEHQNYADAKAYQTASLEKEEQHKLALAQLYETHACEIESALTVANKETTNKLETEKVMLMAGKEYSTNLRKERQRSSDKLKKEGQKAVNEDSHKR